MREVEQANTGCVFDSTNVTVIHIQLGEQQINVSGFYAVDRLLQLAGAGLHTMSRFNHRINGNTKFL